MNISRDQWLAGGNRITLPGQTQAIFVRQDGPVEGRPVTLLHGFPSSSHDWAEVLPDLIEAGLRVTTLDFLGFGASDKPRPHAYSLLEQADLVEALWAELGIPVTALVAHDYGVSVAQELLARETVRVERVVWLNGGLFPDLHRPTKGQKLLRGRLGPVAARLFSARSYASALREILGRPVPDEMLHDMWLSFSAEHGTLIAPRLLDYIDDRRANAERWATAIADFEGPQLFLWGPVDPVSGAHVVPRIRQVAPAAEVVVLDQEPAVGHYPQLEAPEVVGPLIAGFLQTK